jgi:hypothetical protein
MKHLKNWGAAYILLSLFVLSWYFQYETQWREYIQDQQTHSEPVVRSEFWIVWWKSTLENWQSEFLQLFVQVILVASYFQKNLFQADYNADKEDVDKILIKLGRIERKLSE